MSILLGVGLVAGRGVVSCLTSADLLHPTLPNDTQHSPNTIHSDTNFLNMRFPHDSSDPSSLHLVHVNLTAIDHAGQWNVNTPLVNVLTDRMDRSITEAEQDDPRVIRA